MSEPNTLGPEPESGAVELSLVAPVDGLLVPIEEIPDPVFSQKMMGDGISVDPTSGLLVSPCAGEIATLHRAQHAVTIKARGGVTVLLHIGLDTVNLGGKGFKALVRPGQQVQAKQPLIEFDLDAIAQQAVSLLTQLVITEGADAVSFKGVKGAVSAGADEVMRVLTGKSVASTRHVGELEQTERFQIVNEGGVHARPAAQLAARAKRFSCVVYLHSGNEKALVTSVTDVMGLDLVKGQQVWLSARGADASPALAELRKFIEGGLGEDPSAATKPPMRSVRFVSNDDNVLGGVSAAPGLAVGRVVVQSQEVPEFAPRTDDASAAREQLRQAIDAARQDVSEAERRFTRQAEREKAEIFAAHAELLADDALCTHADLEIGRGASAAAAWQSAVAARIAKLSALNNPLMRERSADLKDVGARVLRKILGVAERPAQYSRETVLVSDELTPSEVAGLNAETVGALVTSLGGPTSHAAIIARSIGVPYVTGVGDAITRLRAGTRVIVNGDQGWVDLAPNDQALQAARQELEERKARDEQQLQAAHPRARTVDGREIEVAANIGSVADAERAVQQGCDGVGLLRSEFLFLKRRQAPTEDEQRAQYAKIGVALGKERSLVVRTLDVGGDKPLSYMPLPVEENPFLGVRGIRLSLEYPDQFSSQLRAILSAAEHTKLRVMFPMVAQVDEFLRARDALLEQAHSVPRSELEIGIMVEVPSAALMSDELAREADFFSIGTNDLTQYTLAMDRGHPKLAPKADAMDPAVLRLIRMTANAAHEHGRWVGICGGLAADLLATPLLIGLGIDELSVPPPAIPGLKAHIRKLNHLQCKALAEEALKLSCAEQIRRLYQNFNA